MKRIISVLMSIMMVFGMTTVSAYAEETDPEETMIVAEETQETADDAVPEEDAAETAVDDQEADAAVEDGAAESFEAESADSENDINILIGADEDTYNDALSQLVASTDEDAFTAMADDEYALARLLVIYTDTVDLSGYEGVTDILDDGTGMIVVQFETADQARAAAALIAELEDVESVEPDKIEQYFTPEEITLGEDDAFSAQSTQWDVSMVGADDYAEYANWAYGTDKVVVAVVDTGIYSDHEWFSGRLVKGHDFIDSDSDPDDLNGHGTHVCGTVALCTENAASHVKIMAVKCFYSDGSADDALICSGIKYAAKRANVINMSFGGTHESNALEKAISYAIGLGATCVVAAGNEQSNIEYASTCPAHISDVITVSAVDSSYSFAYDFSNFGDAVDMAAPGVNIYSAYNGNWGYDYAYMDGTSQATPHVSACAALVKLVHPDWTPADIQANLKNSCADYGAAGKDVDYGYGIIDLSILLAQENKNSNCDHTYTWKTTVKATTKNAGTRVGTCTKCGYRVSKTVAKIASFTLSTTEYTANGKARKPAVTVKNSKGTVISSSYYTVTYSNNISSGLGKVKITFKGRYSGTKTITFKINPGKVKVTSAQRNNNVLSLTWKKPTGSCTGYQIIYSKNANFSSSHTITISSKQAASLAFKVSTGTYYVKVRAYQKSSGTTLYSAWSNVYAL